MLEVCFESSVKGCLALAQCCGGDIIGGAVGIITDKKGVSAFFAKRKALKEYYKKQRELHRRAVPLGGTREEIAGISFGLSEGDIHSPICPGECPRKEYIRSVFSFGRYGGEGDTEEAVEDFWRGSVSDLQKVRSGPPKVRIWLDHTPDAQCGLLFAADLLKDSGTEIHVVELPPGAMREDGGNILRYRGWGEVEPQLYGTFLERERVLSGREKNDLAHRWQLLREENAPLRVVEDGAVISVGENYYDDRIRKEFPGAPCKVGRVIAGALTRQGILTGDVFVAKRVQEFIRSGELRVVSGWDGGFYDMVVSRAK